MSDIETSETETTYSTVEGKIRDWALFSGGHDSLVSTHYCMENDYCEAVLHLDTTTGIPENQEFVINICEEYGWPLRIERSPMTFREFVLEYGSGDEPFGFPGPSFHRVVYIILKERALRTVSLEMDEKPRYWTGVRESESQRRMKTVEPESEESNWIWKGPIHDWSDDDVEEYMLDNDLPRNPVVDNIHRSGECYCGAFASRDEELIDLQANYPGHYEWLVELEDEVIEEIGEERKAYWANGHLSQDELRHLKKARKPDGPVLCTDCRRKNTNPIDDW